MVWSALASLLVVMIGSAHGAPSAKTLDYRVVIEGEMSKALKDELTLHSAAVARLDEKAETLAQLIGRARDDKATFTDVLRSRGYYRPFIRLSVAWEEGKRLYLIDYHVSPGPLYRIDRVRVAWEQTPHEPPSPSIDGGGAADAAAVIAAEGGMVTALREKGYPYALARERSVVVDHANRTVSVVYRIAPGPIARFGATRFEPTPDVAADYLARRLPWEEGDLFDERLLVRCRKAMEATGIFSRVRVAPDGEVSDGKVAILVDSSLRAPHTVSAGVYYRSDDKLGAKAGWEHRNLTGVADRLRIEGDVSSIRREGRTLYTRPEFLRHDVSLKLDGLAAYDVTVAYHSRYQDGTAALEYDHGDGFAIGLGGGGRRGEVEPKSTNRRFGYSLVYGLAYGRLDLTDSPLDPKWGARLSVWTAPHYGDSEGAVSFLKTVGRADLFVTIGGHDLMTLAVRGEVGVIQGIPFDNVPADLRFYAGGAGSVRGYAYQTVGPYENGAPTGGRSVATGSAEMRFRLGTGWGAALFADAGYAYRGDRPDFGERPLLGVGLGMRYHTSFGPLRFDVAIPLNRRESIDPALQFYIGLGQAF
jgi:translocation and assembly module TamA